MYIIWQINKKKNPHMKRTILLKDLKF